MNNEIVLKILKKKYGKPSCGRNRACFYSKHCVIKFPLNMNGVIDNKWEASYKDSTCAKGKIVIFKGVELLIQEKLSYPKNFKNLPDWVDFVDCMQVGYDKRGNLKAYDFGIR